MEKKKKWVLLSLSIPAFLLIFIFMIVPLGNAVRVSFFKWNGYSQKMKFIGLENYISLFSDKVFWRSTFNTFIYGFGSTLLQNIFGLSAALFVNKQFKGRNFVRLILYMPIMISGVIMGAIQYYVFNYRNRKYLLDENRTGLRTHYYTDKQLAGNGILYADLSGRTTKYSENV